MASRMSQRTVYVLTAVIVASMVAGFTVADLSLNGSVNTSNQGSQTTLVLSVPGLTWVGTNLTVIPSSGFGSQATVCTPSTAPCEVTAASAPGYMVCAGGFPGSVGCAASDFVEQVNLLVSPTRAFPLLPIALTVYVTGSPVGSVATSTWAGNTSYFDEGTVSAVAPGVTESILIDFDIGMADTGPGSISVISLVATTVT